jgi:hypothetical protein
MQRRDFLLHTSMLASIAATASFAYTALNKPHSEDLSAATLPLAGVTGDRFVGAVLVDERFAESRRFAAVCSARGATVISLSEDIGRLWHGSLRKICAQRNTRVAGLTPHTDLFISQDAARDFGKTLRAFGSHHCFDASTVIHSVSTGAAACYQSNTQWPETVAQAFLNMGPSDSVMVDQFLSKNAIRQSDGARSLYSWMIA